VSVELRNTSGTARDVAGRTIEEDELLVVEGDLDAENSPADGHLIGGMVWPAAHWSIEPGGDYTAPPAPDSDEED
jgi:hypothetical protein